MTPAVELAGVGKVFRPPPAPWRRWLGRSAPEDTVALRGVVHAAEKLADRLRRLERAQRRDELSDAPPHHILVQDDVRRGAAAAGHEAERAADHALQLAGAGGPVHRRAVDAHALREVAI